MARKKKSEPKPVELPEEPVEQNEKVPEDGSFIPFENGFIDSETPTVSEVKEDKYVTTTFNKDDYAMPIEEAAKHDLSYINKITHAFEVIEKCNLYIWSGLDWGVGRIYEMARKEWANYILAMYEWSDNGFKGVEPEKPSEVA